MADIFTTTDATIYSKDGTKAVDVITDGAIERLAVDAKFTAVSIGAVVNEANIFQTAHQDITSKTAFTLLSYTVPTGKKFLLTTFFASADHPLAIDIALRVNSVEKIEYYLDPGNGNDERHINLTSPTTFATAGQTIDVYVEPMMPRGEVNVIYCGIEIDV